MMRLPLLALLLALAGCGGERQDAAPPTGVATTAAASPGPAPATSIANVIPARFLGVWDARTGTCDPASDLRLDIREDKITFYESIGTVESVRDDEGATIVTLAMEGEGERWTQTIGLRLVDAGTSLMVIDPERPRDAEQAMRRRCSG